MVMNSQKACECFWFYVYASSMSVLFFTSYLLSVVCVLIFLPEAAYICIYLSQYIYNRTFLPPFSETESELVDSEVGSIYICSHSGYLHFNLFF